MGKTPAAPAGKASAPAGKKTPPPAPLPAGTEAVKQNPELVGQPAQTSPAGVILTPHVPAPIPPLEANPVLPKEAQPAAQGSLTPAQVERREALGNPAIKPAKAPEGHANHVVDDPKVKRNEDGFIPGEEVHPDVVIATERKRAQQQRETAAREQAAK